MKKEFTYKQKLIRAMPHSFIRILIENKLFEAYIKNATKGEYYMMQLGLTTTLNPARYIDSSFRWAFTPEGYHTWNRIYLMTIML